MSMLSLPRHLTASPVGLVQYYRKMFKTQSPSAGTTEGKAVRRRDTRTLEHCYWSTREDIQWSHINAQIKLERGGEGDEGKDGGNKQKRVTKMVSCWSETQLCIVYKRLTVSTNTQIDYKRRAGDQYVCSP